MNTLFKVMGLLCFLNAILCITNVYHPDKIDNVSCYLALGLIFISAKYTSKTNNNIKIENIYLKKEN